MPKSLYEPVDNPRTDIYSSRPRQTAPITPCPGGEIGRHASFRCWWPQGRGGSSPLLGTTLKKSLDSDIGAFLFVRERTRGRCHFTERYLRILDPLQLLSRNASSSPSTAADEMHDKVPPLQIS